MTPNAILGALIAQLRASTDLSFVQDSDIMEGAREGNLNFPCLMIESIGDSVVEYNYPYEKIVHRFAVVGLVSRYDKNHQLTDDGNNKGVLTFKNLVKKAITSNATFSNLADVYDVKCPSSEEDNTQFPIRGFNMVVEVLYRQDRSTRA